MSKVSIVFENCEVANYTDDDLVCSFYGVNKRIYFQHGEKIEFNICDNCLIRIPKYILDNTYVGACDKNKTVLRDRIKYKDITSITIDNECEIYVPYKTAKDYETENMLWELLDGEAEEEGNVMIFFGEYN